MEKNRIFRILSSFMFIMVFLTSSFDIFGSIILLGFNLRVMYVFIFMGAVLSLIYWIKEKKFFWPEGFIFLGAWALLIFLFIPNTPLIIRNVGYAVWLAINISFIFISITLINSGNIKTVMRLYILSFFAMAVFGIVQYITPQIGLPPVGIRQWWIHPFLPRINGFSYEPSYYATYLLFGLPMTILLLSKGETAGLKKWFMFAIISVEVVALMLCSSRIGILVFAVFLFGFLIYTVVRQIKKREFDLTSSLTFAIPVALIFLSFAWMDLRMKMITEDPSSSIYLRDTGLTEDDITQGNSFKARIGAMVKTFEVFTKNPVIGVSLGGIAPWIAAMEGAPVNSNTDVKPYEGINVLFEVLAASGVIGFILFIIYMIRISRFVLLKEYNNGLRKYYTPLLFGFIVGFVMLLENQNILRPYVWVHIAMISAAIRMMIIERKGASVPA
jgi:hypothetical protein